MKSLSLPIIILVIALVLGITFRKSPYQLRGEGQPIDQAALDHRDSPYSHVTWVVSDIGNYAQLRFFDKIEGGVCVSPSWGELQALAKQDQRLSHLVAGSDWTFKPEAGPTWPTDRPHPDQGTVSNTKYTCLYPAGVLMNDGLIKRAGGDPRKAAPNVLIVGLGSGIGISVLAHHFPEASINVVDIDQAVIDMVNEHYPLFRWLQSQQTSDGRPRLSVHAADARQYIHFPELRHDNGRRYDLVVLDAYTSGSTIPSHLMTREFYQTIRDDVLTEDGILFSNIIGSYSGEKRYVLGGAVRSMNEAGLTEVWNLPVVYPSFYDRPPLLTSVPRNNVVLASTQALDPRGAKASWERLRAWTNYPELALDTYVSSYVMQAKSVNNQPRSTSPGTHITDEALKAKLWHHVRKQHSEEQQQLHQTLKERGLSPFAQRDDDDLLVIVREPELINEVGRTVKANQPDIKDWQNSSELLMVRWTDWVAFTRRTWERSIRESADVLEGDYEHDGHTIVGRHITDAPLFTDAQPNADILNR